MLSPEDANRPGDGLVGYISHGLPDGFLNRWLTEALRGVTSGGWTSSGASSLLKKMINFHTSSLPSEGFAWALTGDSRLVWSSWRSGHILYQVSSGETHYLNAAGASVLQRLSEGPGTFADICNHIAGTDGFSDDEVFIRQVADLLARFDELGLVARHDFLAGTA